MYGMADERIANYTEARQNLKSSMDSATEDRVPDATMETFHLLRSPRNAERLRAGIADVEAGKVVEADLVDGTIAERP